MAGCLPLLVSMSWLPHSDPDTASFLSTGGDLPVVRIQFVIVFDVSETLALYDFSLQLRSRYCAFLIWGIATERKKEKEKQQRTL